MFDALKNLGNLGSMLARAREMQEKLGQVRENLAAREVEADAGGGMVRAVVNGRLELVRLHIDKSKIDPTDTELLEDMIVAAVHAAQTRAAAVARAELERLAQEAGLPPGALPNL